MNSWQYNLDSYVLPILRSDETLLLVCLRAMLMYVVELLNFASRYDSTRFRGPPGTQRALVETKSAKTGHSTSRSTPPHSPHS
jgi:hypothetical protein